MKNRLLSLIPTLLLSVFTTACFTQNLVSQAKTAYENGALFKAKSLCSQYLKTDKNEELFKELSQAFQLYANINYAIGLPEQYKAAIDSMWKYRSKLDREIYFVEYAAYKIRYLTYFHQYSQAIKLVEKAKSVLKENSAEAHLIDTLFFHANVINTYRNTFLKNLSNAEKQKRKWILFKHYERFEWFAGTDAIKKAIYCTFLGNVMQDFVWYREGQYSKEMSDSAFVKSLYYYKKGRKIILEEFGRENHLSARLASLIALQYAKNDSQKDSVLYWCNKALEASQITATNQQVYRHLKYPLFASRLKAAILIENSAANSCQLRQQIAELESMLSHRSYYVSKFLQKKNDRFAQGYALDPADELNLLYRQQLNFAPTYKDSLECFRQIWKYQSVRYNKASYYEALQNHLGKETVEQLMREFHDLYEQKQVLYDELFLARIKEIETDTISLKDQISEFHEKHLRFLEECPSAFKKFIENSSQESLSELQIKLKNDEAFVLYYYSRGMLFSSTNRPFALVATQSKVNLVNLKTKEQTIDWKLSRKPMMPSKYKRQAFAQYHNFFKEIDHALDSSYQNLKISITPRLSQISFESTLRDTSFTSWENAPLVLKDRAISYTQNHSVEYLNSFRAFSRERHLIQPNCDSSKLVSTPFSQDLAKQLHKEYSFYQFSEFKPIVSDSAALILQILSHGKVDSMLKVHHAYYKSQTKFNENAIFLCHEVLNLSDFDEQNVRAKLAVMVACESGSGLIEENNGRYDYSRVLLKNGSQTVLTSLIETDDQSTAQILKSFYEYLADGKKVAVALQQAKLDFLAQIKDPGLYNPVYWAGLKVDGIDQKIDLNQMEEVTTGMDLIIVLLGVGVILICCYRDFF